MSKWAMQPGHNTAKKDTGMFSRLIDEILGTNNKSDNLRRFEKWRSGRRNNVGSSFEYLEERIVLANSLGTDPDGPLAPLNGNEMAGGSTLEDTPVVINLVPPSAMPLNPSGTISLITATGNTNGGVIANGDGSVTYTPALNFSGRIKFTYQLAMDPVIGQIILDVTAVNDKPTQTVPGAKTVVEDSTGNVISGISVADVDAGGGTLTTTITSNTGLLDATLSGTASKGGAGTTTLTVSGKLADLNATLGSLTYSPTIQVAGTDTLTISTNDNGNTPAPAAISNASMITINITGVNDAPVANVPVSFSIAEDAAPVGLGGISISDIDAGVDPVVTTVSVNSGGQLSFTGGLPAGLTSTTTPAGSVTLTGPQAETNTYLLSLTYDSADNFNGTETLSISINDQGNNPSGALTGSATVPINVSAVNDAPVLTIPDPGLTVGTPINVAEDTLTAIPGVSVADLDLNETAMATIDVTVSASIGTVTLNGMTSASETVSGSLATVNALLSALQYQGPLNDGTSAVTLTVTTDDNGNTGSGGILMDSDPLYIQLTPVNDAPELTVPDTSMTRITIAEDGSHMPSPFSILDVDSGGDTIRVTLSTNQGGILAVPTPAGGTVMDNGTSTVVVEGPVAAVSTSLGGTSYSPAANYNGNEDVTVFAEDLGNNGDGGPKTDTEVIGYTITPVNDAPTFTVEDIGSGTGVLPAVLEDPGPQTVSGAIANISPGPADESGQALTFSATAIPMGSFSSFNINSSTGQISYTLAPNVNGSISINVTLTDDGGTPGTMSPETDDDASTTIPGALSLTVTPVNDKPNFSLGTAPVLSESPAVQPVSVPGFFNVTTFGAPDESGQTVSVLSVQNNNNGFFTVQPAISPTTGELTYTVGANKSGTVLVDVFMKDSGGTANGGIDTSITRTFPIVVSGVNEAPSISVPGSLTTAEDTQGIFGTIDVDDPDSGASDIQLDLTVGNGTLNLASTSGLTITNIPAGMDPAVPITLPASSVRLTGTLAELDAALLNNGMGNGLNYTPNLNFNGSDTLSLTLNDLGNTGSGGPLSDTDTVSISITPVNDPVVVTSMFADPVNANEDDPDTVIPLGISPFVGSNYFADPDASDTPPEAIGLNISSSNPAVVTANQSFGNLILDYQPNAFGTSIVTVEAFDTVGNTAVQTFTVNVANEEDSPVVANPIADQPLAEDFSTLMFGLDSIPVFTDADVPFGDSLTYSVGVSGPGILSASIDNTDPMNRKLVVSSLPDKNTPLDGAMPPAQIPTVVSVTATDQAGNMVTDSFNVTATPVNDRPIANPDTATTSEDSVGVLINVLGNDMPGPATATDEASQTVSLIGIGTDASFGEVTIALNGTSFIYQPDPNFFGTDTFTYQIIDDGSPPAVSVISAPKGVVTINVTPVNDAPVITSLPPNATVPEDSTSTVAGIIVGDIDSSLVTVTLDVDKGGSLSATAQGSATVTPGSLDITGSVPDVNATLTTLMYSPAADANSGVNSLNGPEILSVTVTDLEGLQDMDSTAGTPQTIEFTISPVNDAPRFNVLNTTVTVNEGSGAHTADGSAVAGPADEVADGQTVTGYAIGTVTDTSGILDGAPTVDAAGVISYAVVDDIVGTATIQVIATDSLGLSTTLPNGVLTVNSIGLNQPPVITILGQTPIQKPISSGSVDVLNFAIIAPGPDPGSPTGSDFPEGQKLTTISVSNDNPGLFTVRPDFEISLTANDAQGDEVVLGNLTFTVAPGISGIANAVMTAFDDAGTPLDFSDDLSSSFAFQIIIGNPSSDSTPPQVSGVKVSGSTWTSTFLAEVDPGNSVGYAVPTGAAQEDPLSWSSLNQITVQFDEPVMGSGSGGAFLPADFSLTGVTTLALPISSVSGGGTNTATLTLASALTNDRWTLGASSARITDLAGNPLDGKWVNGSSTFDSGNGTPEDFFFGINVLRGDANQDGSVNFLDLNSLGLSFGQGIGGALYTILQDTSGDGNINFFELNDLGLNFGKSLPPGSFPAVAAAVDHLFDDVNEDKQIEKDQDIADEFAADIAESKEKADLFT